ncbi:hypothetical protein NEAUS04_0263 [Nematocida ausubeli]|nr:hypothetical protein NEAUS07_0374 [Nematocida ausubeli]KAI5136824.1 hypothetical protein NEAUS06_2034 [Nematocida ausubeli]KAI5147098.1 hypothetical protein NEAUS05_0425 [Nematocida ausubeli]KAI5161051.1 hypothetical protein NEAUS04_0263 [Nematocida ausubeli]
MQDSRKRGRKPREGEKMDRVDVVCFKCPYSACGLQYQSSLGYKRHLMYYKHSIFTPSNKKIVCGYMDCTATENLREHITREHMADAAELLEAYEIMIKVGEETEEVSTAGLIGDIVHDEGLLDISKVMTEDGIVKEILLSIFPKGVTHIIDMDTFSESNQIFYCRIPGCGRQFKSLMAYKYHCGKFTHLFKSIIDDYTEKNGPLDYEEIKGIFKKKFNLENRFLLEGISHHLMRMPDQHYNFIFTFDDTQLGHEKRRIKKKGVDMISEYSIGSEDRHDYDEDDVKRVREEEPDDKSHFKIDSIVFNGRQLPHVQSCEQGRVAFLNLYLEAMLLAVVEDHVIVGTKGEVDEDDEHQEIGKPHNIFTFSSGSAVFFVLAKNKILSETTFEGYGFPRKLMPYKQKTMLVLFNDGALRELSINADLKLEIVQVIKTKAQVVSFTIFQGDIIVCSHRMLINLSSKKERAFESPIISLETTNDSIIVVDSNGRTCCINSSFEDVAAIPSKVGTNVVTWLDEEPGLFFISNSLYGMGRVYSAATNSTLLISPHACTHVILIKPGFIASSGLDGSFCVSSYRTDPKVYMKVLRTEIRGDELFIATSEEEHALTENVQPICSHDYRVTIQGIVKHNRNLVAVLACGIVIIIDNFFI